MQIVAGIILLAIWAIVILSVYPGRFARRLTLDESNASMRTRWAPLPCAERAGGCYRCAVQSCAMRR